MSFSSCGVKMYLFSFISLVSFFYFGTWESRVCPLCTTSTCFLIFPSLLHGVNIDPAYGKRTRREKRYSRNVARITEKKRRAKKTFPPHIQCTRNVLYRPRFQGQRRPFFFFEKYYGFLGKKGEEGGRRIAMEREDDENRLSYFFPSPAHPCKTFSSPSPLPPFTSPSYFCALLPPSPALKRDEAEEEEEAPDAQHTLSPPRLFFAVVESFSIFGRRVYKIRHGFRNRGGMYASSMCMCTYM